MNELEVGFNEPKAPRRRLDASTLSEPEDGTQMNSTENSKGDATSKPTESSIEKDFESSFDDSFVLRNKL